MLRIRSGVSGMMYPMRVERSLASFPAPDSSPLTSISMILAQAYDATMMPVPASRDSFQQCKLPLRTDGVPLSELIARGTSSADAIEQATAESEQRT